jgi:hypothetical protein
MFFNLLEMRKIMIVVDEGYKMPYWGSTIIQGKRRNKKAV